MFPRRIKVFTDHKKLVDELELKTSQNEILTRGIWT